MLKKKYYTGVQIHEAIDGVVGDYKKAIEIYRRLAKMETDDVQPVKHGKWVIERDRNVMHCDVCGWAFEYYSGLEDEWNYCPHCGAPMDRSEDGETKQISAEFAKLMREGEIQVRWRDGQT